MEMNANSFFFFFRLRGHIIDRNKFVCQGIWYLLVLLIKNQMEFYKCELKKHPTAWINREKFPQILNLCLWSRQKQMREMSE